jgi:hypothetical protein
MRQETDSLEAQALRSALSAAAETLASIFPCPFAEGRLLNGTGHFDNKSARCHARGLRRRRARPFVLEMVRFVASSRQAQSTESWDALASRWNSENEQHRYASGRSMKGAYYTAVRLNRGQDAVPGICTACVIEALSPKESDVSERS